MQKKVFITLLLVCFTALAFAGTGDDLEKNVNNLIRKAENAYFSSNIKEADEILGQANTGLEQLKTSAPDHRSLKNLQNKYDRLKKRIDQKLAKTSKTSPTTKTASKIPAGSDDPDASGKLQSGALSSLKNADREMNQAEERLGQARAILNEHHFDRFTSRIYAVEEDLKDAKVMLDRTERSYKTNATHPLAAPYFQRYNELVKATASLKQQGTMDQEKAAATSAQAKTATKNLDMEWLPKINAFIKHPSASYIGSPTLNDPARLDEQDQIIEKAQMVLADFTKNIPADTASWELNEAVKDLRFSIGVYQNERNAGITNLRNPVVTTMTQWEQMFAANKNWTENSKTSLFIVRPKKITYLKKQIEELATVSPEEATQFSARLAVLEKENAAWVKKRQAWESRPRPFPQGKMSNTQLEEKMISLLENGGWKVKGLVIVDKDWWVLKGEYRYIQAAALSEDAQGPFWSYVSFKQNTTLTGYGPTELWETNDKIRMP